MQELRRHCGTKDSRSMDQNTRWLVRYNEVKNFIEENHRNPSKYYDEEKLMVHFLKRNRKLMNAGELQEPRLGKFMELLELCEQNKHKNQYEYNNNSSEIKN